MASMWEGATSVITLLSAEIPCFDVQGEMQPCDWFNKIQNLDKFRLSSYKNASFVAYHIAAFPLVHRDT